MTTFDPDGLRKRLAELETELSQPGFWDDQQHAAQVAAEHARVQRRLERYDRLQRDYDDARELLAMDGDMADEIAASIAPLRTIWNAMPTACAAEAQADDTVKAGPRMPCSIVI